MTRVRNGSSSKPSYEAWSESAIAIQNKRRRGYYDDRKVQAEMPGIAGVLPNGNFLDRREKNYLAVVLEIGT